MENYEASNRQRLIALLAKVESRKAPPGWRPSASVAVGGLTEIGFSKKAELLLVLSGQGRGVVDCSTGQKVARDNKVDGAWLDAANLSCMGIGPIEDEVVSMSGLHGGGLPTSTEAGESLELVWPEWPKAQLVFCAGFKSAFIDGHQPSCWLIASDYIRAFGFSWSGQSFAYASGGDVHVFTRDGLLTSGSRADVSDFGGAAPLT